MHAAGLDRHAVFLTSALSNNTVSSKTPVLTLFVVLILAYVPRRTASRAAAGRDGQAAG